MEKWIELALAVFGSGTAGAIIMRILERRNHKAAALKTETEVSGLDIENEIKMADAWKEQYKDLKTEVSELRVMYREIESKSIQLMHEVSLLKRKIDDKEKEIERLRKEKGGK